MKKNNHFFNFFLLIILIFIFCIPVSAVSIVPPINLSEYESENAKYRPQTESNESEYDIYKNGNYPEKFDLREIGRVSGAKEQKFPWDEWAFASTGAIESSMTAKGIYLDISEDYLIENSGLDRICKMNIEKRAAAFFASQAGVVLESDSIQDEPFLKMKINAYFVDKDDIKEMLYNFGAVQSSINFRIGWNEFFNNETFSQYSTDEYSNNDQILITGWDDKYPKENFVLMPPGDGAWICKASEGMNWGDGGYFYLSYYDASIANNNLVYNNSIDDGERKNIYQYQISEDIGAMGYAGYEDNWFANTFNKNPGIEQLDSVGFYTFEDNVEYEVWVIKDFKNDGLNSREYVGSGMLQYKGYHTVELDKKLILDAQEFGVVVKVSTNIDRSIGVSLPDPTIDDRRNKGYLSYNGEAWLDLGIYEEYKADVCLKAFTINESSPLEPDFLKNAEEWETCDTYDINKSWIIKFSENLHGELNADKVAIYDALTYEPIITTHVINEDNIIVTPANSYDKKEYILYIGDITSSSGQRLKNAVKMKFIVN